MTLKYILFGHLPNCIYENQMMIVVFDINSCKFLCILPAYGTYPLCKYSRLRNVSIFRYGSQAIRIFKGPFHVRE